MRGLLRAPRENPYLLCNSGTRGVSMSLFLVFSDLVCDLLILILFDISYTKAVKFLKPKLGPGGICLYS